MASASQWVGPLASDQIQRENALYDRCFSLFRTGSRCGLAARRCGWAIISVHVVLLGVSGWLQSPTLNEPGHLVAGIHHWTAADFTLYRVNPPLIRAAASLPAVLCGYAPDWSGYYEHVGARPIFGMGEDFIAANGRRSLAYFTLARWACIPFSVLGAWVSFSWARDLFGGSAAVMACALWCFSPMVLGHASMIAPDAHATALGLAACYTFWRWLCRPTWRQAVVTGVVLGLAELAKTTMILFYPLWPLLWLVFRWQDRHAMTVRRWRNEAGMLLLRMCIGLYVLNLGYLGEGTFSQLKDFVFISQMFSGESTPGPDGGNRFHGSLLGLIPIPLPANYVIGIDVQQRDFEDFSRPSYLRGRYQSQGWWYYYAYAVLFKAPIGTLGLIALTLLTAWTRYGPRISFRDALILLSPAVLIFVVASLKSGFSHHSRYVLPCIPFVFIWISGLGAHFPATASTVAAVWERAPRRVNVPRRRARRATVGILTLGLLLWSASASLGIYPHSLSYFNRFAGGPLNGPEHLLNSNVDWGQDLLFLERWMEDRSDVRVGPVHLAFYNYYNPFDLGIEGIVPWPFGRSDTSEGMNVPEGYYAISVNLLYEFPWPVRDHEGRRYFIDPRPLPYLRTLEPIGMAGYSIRVYSANQVREAYAAPEAPRLWNPDGDTCR